MKPAKLLTIAILLSLNAQVCRGGDNLKAIAREFSKQAGNKGIEQVAVIPFIPIDGSDPAQGRIISEKLITLIVRQGLVKTVERGMLSSIMEEHYLAFTGIIDAAAARKLGRVLSADAIITGTFSTENDSININARLINTQTGDILAAREGFMPLTHTQMKDALSDIKPFAQAAMFVDVPELDVPAPQIRETANFFEKTAAGKTDCSDAFARVDALEKSILDIKARYWAIRLKNGLDLRSLTANPGSTISDPELKRNFYQKLNYYYYEKNGEASLSSRELKKFKVIDEEAYRIYNECGI